MPFNQDQRGYEAVSLSGYQKGHQKVAFGAVQIMSAMNKSGTFCAWGKRGQLLRACPFEEPGEVCFEFGETREDAIANLLAADFPDINGPPTVEFNGVNRSGFDSGYIGPVGAVLLIIAFGVWVLV